MVTNRNRSSSRHGSKGVPVNINTCEQNGQKQIIWCKLDFNFMTVWFHTNSSCPWNYPWFVSLGFFPRFLFMFFSLRHLPQRPWSAPVRRRHQSPEHRPRQPVTTVGITPGIVGATCGIVNHMWTWMNMIYCWTCGETMCFSYTWFTEEKKHVPTTCCFLLRIFLQVFWKGSTVRPKGSKLPTLSHLPDDDIGKSRVDISLVLQMFWRLKRGVVTTTQTSTSNHDWNMG